MSHKQNKRKKNGLYTSVAPPRKTAAVWHQCAEYNLYWTHLSKLSHSAFCFQREPLIKMSHSIWTGSSPVSRSICYCSHRQSIFLTRSWSRTCNLCWCAYAAYGAAAPRHVDALESLQMKTKSEAEKGGRDNGNILCMATVTHSCMLPNSHTCTRHGT